MQADETVVEQDLVNAVVEGYFRIPAVWVGSEPTEVSVEERRLLGQQVMHKATLRCGIDAYAMRNGLFLFDFLRARIGEVVRVPGYERPATETWRPPQSHMQAVAKTKQVSVLRAQIMNVHQACLISSEQIVASRAATMGFPVTAWNTVQSIGIAHPVSYYDDGEDVHALARNVLDGRYSPSIDPPARRVLELDVVAHSFESLDHILNLDDARYIPMVEAAYQSACRSVELRFGESIAIGWTVCEQLISEEWRSLLANSDSRRTADTKLTQARKRKLSGRDYTASVMVDMLELHGWLTPSIYENLEIARKARNKWAHDMEVPNQDDVQACQKAIRELLSRKEIQIWLQLSFRGAGGAAWPLRFFQKVHGSDLPGFTT